MNNPQTQGSTGNGLSTGSTDAGGGDLKSSFGAVAQQAKAQGQERIESTRQATAITLEKLAEGVRGAVSELERDGTVGNLSTYIARMSESMTTVASGLRDKSGDDLVREVGRIARENPTVFVAGAVAIGFGLTRFARASTKREHGDAQSATQGGADVGSDLAGTASDVGASTSLSSAGERGGTDTAYSAGSLGGSSAGTGLSAAGAGLSAGSAGLSGASASTGSAGASSGGLSQASSGGGLSGASGASQGFADTGSTTNAGASSGVGLSGGSSGISEPDASDIGSRGLDAQGDQQYASGGGSTPGLGTGTTPGMSAGPGASLGVRSGDESGGKGA